MPISDSPSSSTSAFDVRVAVKKVPEIAWSFEHNEGFVLEVENLCLAELADADGIANLRYAADLFDLDGKLVRRMLFDPFPAVVGIGETRHFELGVGLTALAGDYNLRFEIERVEGGPVAVSSQPGAVRLKSPIFQMFIELVNVCNFACTFCPQPGLQRKGQTMDFDLAKKILHDLSDMGHHHPINVHLLGEPLLYPRFFDFVEAAHDIGQTIFLVTNGSKFTPETVEEIFRVKLDELMISLNTPEREFYEEQRGAKMSYEDYNISVVRMVEEVVRRGAPPRTIIQILYDGAKTHDPAEMIRTNRIIQDWADIVRSASGDSQLSVEEITEFDASLTTYVELYPGLQLQFTPYHTWGEGSAGGERFCSFPLRQLVVLADGQASICCVDAEGEINIGDANSQSIESIWEGPKLKAIRDAFWVDLKAIEPRCQRCTINHRDIAETYRP